MKNSSIKLIKLLCTAILSVICFSDLNAQVGIGVPAGEAPQATLDIRYDSAVSPGFLMPRVTVLPAGNISEGMLILYCAGCTDTDGDGAINYEGGIYYVYVDNDGDGTLEWTPLASNAGVVEIDEQAPSAPSNLVASNPTSSTIDLSWSASTDNVSVAGYFIYFSDGTLATTAPSNSITVNGLNPSTSYTFYVTAYDAVMNESGQSNTATQITTGLPDTEAPTAPANLVASNITTSSIDLTWNASTDNVGVVGYYVYQGGVQVSDVTSSTSTTISGLSESTQYSFYVTAYDAAGNESSQSNTVTPSTTGTCVETTFCNHNFDNGQFGCWNGASGATISNGGGETYAALEGKFDPNIYSGPYDFTGFSRINVSFLAETNNNWDNSDDYFLEIKIGNGNYQQLQSWGRTTNWTSRSYNITQGQYLTQNVTIRIRSNANKNDEDVYIDNASIIGYCD
tara:strand:+ start:387 stop:1748 length:1362 start_codon:yes stop_codon:yes gene_type:complete